MARQNERDLAELRRFGKSADEIQGFIGNVVHLLESGLTLLPPPVRPVEEGTFNATESMRSWMLEVKQQVRILASVNHIRRHEFQRKLISFSRQRN